VGEEKEEEKGQRLRAVLLDHVEELEVEARTHLL